MADGPRTGTRRDAALVVRLTPEERATLHAAARASGHPQTAAWVRGLALATASGGPAPVARKPAEQTPALEVVAELRRIGNNLNQLTRVANAGGGIDWEWLGILATDCRKLREWAEEQE